MTITVEMAPELEQQLRHAAAQVGLAPAAYIVETLRQRLTVPQAPHLAATEAQLLLQVNQSLEGVDWIGYHRLIDKRHAERLTPTEHQELIAVTDQIEAASVQRMAALAELARLRGVSLPTLIHELGLQPRRV